MKLNSKYYVLGPNPDAKDLLLSSCSALFSNPVTLDSSAILLITGIFETGI